jgi:hypothetical protein
VRELAALATDSARLQRLIGWDWIAISLAQLPAEYPAPSWAVGISKIAESIGISATGRAGDRAGTSHS